MSTETRRAAEDPTIEVATPDGSDSFGTWLRRQREGRQIALREIADASKISLRYLQALESDRFDVLPAAVFAKGFLRQYARYVGLDPEDVVNFYLSARQAQDLESDEPEEAAARASGGGLFSGWKLLLLVLVLLGLVAVLFHFAERRGEATGTSAASAPTPRVPSPAESPATSAGGSSIAAEDTTASSREEGASAEAGSPTAALTALEAEPAALESVDQSTAPIRVKLDFRGECWLQARLDGRRDLSETKVQGESVDLDAERLVELTFGDGGAVTVEVNGHPLAFDATPGQVVRLTIDEDTVSRLASEASP